MIVLAVLSLACGDDAATDGTGDAQGAADQSGAEVAADAGRDVAEADAPNPDDASQSVGDDAMGDDIPDGGSMSVSDGGTDDSGADAIPRPDGGFFPDEPTGPCLEGGDGARGTLQFSDGEPLEGATVAIFAGDGLKRLGVTDELGQFTIQAPCREITVELAVFESDNFPNHPSIWNLPLANFDASVEEPVLQVSLVSVTGDILDVTRTPIVGAILDARLVDEDLRIVNQQTVGEEGAFVVQLVPWDNAPYDLVASGPAGSDKSFRSATVTTIIGTPPPEPTTFILYEDRCSLVGPVSTSEGVELQWLRLRIGGESYPDGSEIYYSFEEGVYYPLGEADNVSNQVPIFCGESTFQLWNAIWLDPRWPCKNHDNPGQICLNNYPIWRDEVREDPLPDGVEIPVVRLSGVVSDEDDNPVDNVTVIIEAAHIWDPVFFQRTTVYNETVTDENGEYSLAVIPYAELDEVEYTVHTRIRDDDNRPLGDFETMIAIPEDSELNIVLPPGQARCVMTGTVHSSEGVDFNEIMLLFSGVDEEGDALYVDTPWRFFTEVVGVWYRWGFANEDIPFVPFLCGTNYLTLHSADWESCLADANQVCFDSHGWWYGRDLSEAFEGIEVPVVHVSGRVTTDGESEGSRVPVQGASVSASNFTIMNQTSTDADGFYDFVVPLPDAENGGPVTVDIGASTGDTHPLSLLGGGSQGVRITAPLELDIYMPPGPDRCRFSGSVRTSEGVVLSEIDYSWYGPFYGLFGWTFREVEPKGYVRQPGEAPILDDVPIYCGDQPLFGDHYQDMYISSGGYRPECDQVNAFDQPCLSGFQIWDGFKLPGPWTDDIVIPVVYVSGRVTIDGNNPIPGAEIDARATVVGRDGNTIGYLWNRAVSRADGGFRVAVYPSPTEDTEYEIVVTTPLSLDLGEITQPAVIMNDTEIDFDFSSVE